jgi:hypothetical protein
MVGHIPRLNLLKPQSYAGRLHAPTATRPAGGLGTEGLTNSDEALHP